MHKSKNYFSKLDITLWSSSVILIITSFCIFDRESYLTLCASLIGVTSLIFNAKGNPIGQFLMVIFSLLYGVISYTFSYYGEMVTYLGMSSLGPIKYESSSSEVFLGRDYGASNRISGNVANEIDKEVRGIIDSCLAIAKKTIEENKDLLVLIAEALLKYETITADEIDFLVKYGSLDAYDAFKKQSELLAKAKQETVTEVKEENNQANNEGNNNE